MGKPTKDDGLNKWQRYRLKDIEAYRKLKREYAKTEDQKIKRREYQKRWREKNREKHNALANKYYYQNREERLKKSSEYLLMVKYGIDYEGYNKMLENQNGCCFICKRHNKEFKKRLSVDHCHKNGNIRGLLCSHCNGVLGWIEMHGAGIKEYIKVNNIIW